MYQETNETSQSLREESVKRVLSIIIIAKIILSACSNTAKTEHCSKHTKKRLHNHLPGDIQEVTASADKLLKFPH